MLGPASADLGLSFQTLPSVWGQIPVCCHWAASWAPRGACEDFFAKCFETLSRGELERCVKLSHGVFPSWCLKVALTELW